MNVSDFYLSQLQGLKYKLKCLKEEAELIHETYDDDKAEGMLEAYQKIDDLIDNLIFKLNRRKGA